MMTTPSMNAQIHQQLTLGEGSHGPGGPAKRVSDSSAPRPAWLKNINSSNEESKTTSPSQEKVGMSEIESGPRAGLNSPFSLSSISDDTSWEYPNETAQSAPAARNWARRDLTPRRPQLDRVSSATGWPKLGATQPSGRNSQKEQLREMSSSPAGRSNITQGRNAQEDHVPEKLHSVELSVSREEMPEEDTTDANVSDPSGIQKEMKWVTPDEPNWKPTAQRIPDNKLQEDNTGSVNASQTGEPQAEPQSDTETKGVVADVAATVTKGGQAIGSAMKNAWKWGANLVSGKDKEPVTPTANQSPTNKPSAAANQPSPTTSQESGLEDEKQPASLDLEVSHAAPASVPDTKTGGGFLGNLWGSTKKQFQKMTGTQTKAEDANEQGLPESGDGSKNTQPNVSDPLKQAPANRRRLCVGYTNDGVCPLSNEASSTNMCTPCSNRRPL